MRREQFLFGVRTLAYCSLGEILIFGAEYGLNELLELLIQNGNRDYWESLISLTMLLLAALAVAFLYLIIVALVTVVSAVLPDGQVRTYLDDQLRYSGPLERIITDWFSFGHAVRNRVLTVHVWGPRAIRMSAKILGMAVLALLGIAACVYGVVKIDESLSDTPGWAILIIFLLFLILAKK